MAKVSVIVPLYNVEAYLPRCIDSVLAQTFSDFELILVDDGSTDNSGAICDEYAKKDDRIRVIHQENGGLSAARNAGIDLVFKENITEWITFIDSDDWVHPEYLEQLYNAATENGVGMSICEHIRTEKVLEYTANIERAVVYDSEDYSIVGSTNSITAWGKLYKTELFDGIRYPVGKIHEDEYTTYKPLFAAGRVAVIHTPLYFYFVRIDSIMTSKWSPKRLDLLDAYEEQSAFSIEQRYNKFRDLILEKYYGDILYYLWFITGINVENKKQLVKSLKKRLNRITKIRKQFGMSRELERYDKEYGSIYPIRIKLHRYRKALFRKTSKKLAR